MLTTQLVAYPNLHVNNPISLSRRRQPSAHQHPISTACRLALGHAMGKYLLVTGLLALLFFVSSPIKAKTPEVSTVF
jgi:hypothetical protein